MEMLSVLLLQFHRICFSDCKNSTTLSIFFQLKELEVKLFRESLKILEVLNSGDLIYLRSLEQNP